MARTSRSPVWPFLLVVAFLFLLSIMAPREWQRVARRDATRAPVARHVAPVVLPRSAEATKPQSDESAAVEPVEKNEPIANDPPVAAPTLTTQNETQLIAPINVLRGDERHAEEDDPEGIAEINDEASIADLDPAVCEAAEIMAGSRWPRPADLLRRLEKLSNECQCTDWVDRTSELIYELTSHTAPSDQRAQDILTALRHHASNVDTLAAEIQQRAVVTELFRVRHALLRRVEVWELLPPLFHADTSGQVPTEADIARLTAAIEKVDTLMRMGGAEGAQWRSYLMLDDLLPLTSMGADGPAIDAPQMARKFRARLDRQDLSAWQRRFLQEGPVAELADALAPWARQPFDPGRMLIDLEQFETTTQPCDARKLAAGYRHSAALTESTTELANRLETNYRNANFRLVLSEAFLNRLLPKTSVSFNPVRDEVLGHPTRGTSRTSTTVNVILVPDPHKLRSALEASGQIFANTHSTAGPATMYSNSDSLYVARRELDLDVRGIRGGPTECDCIDARTRLRSVSTDFDAVPLVGSLMENFARSKHAESEGTVRGILRRKVESQARQKMDSLTQEQIELVNRKLHERVLTPLERLSLSPQVIAAETTDDRLSLRLRLAADEQLAGHTPRPRAPGDSLLSVQIHQSMFNNVCERLQLSGRSFRLPELRKYIVDTLNLQSNVKAEAGDDDVAVTFADEDPLRLRLDDGKIELSLAVARLSNEDHTWRNFVVRVYYRPEVEGMQVRLVRDGSVQLVGKNLNARAQIALRGVFSKTFSKDRELDLVDSQWTADERTRDLYISQFVIQDGWIGAAVSQQPNNIATQPRQKR